MTAAADSTNDDAPWQAQACESLREHAPECIALMRALYNADLIDGARALTYARTPDGEWGTPPDPASAVALTGPSRAYNPPFVDPDQARWQIKAERAGWRVVDWTSGGYYCRRPAVGHPAETTTVYPTKTAAFKAACERD